MPILLGVIIGWFLAWIIFYRDEEFLIDKITQFRHDIGGRLVVFIDYPPESWRERKAWIGIAKLSDELYFSACPYMKNYEKLEETAKHILE